MGQYSYGPCISIRYNLEKEITHSDTITQKEKEVGIIERGSKP